jgi:hypothetical protein
MRKFGLAILAALLALTGAMRADGQAAAAKDIARWGVRNADTVRTVRPNAPDIASHALPHHVWARMGRDERAGFANALLVASDGLEARMVRNAAILRTLVRGSAEAGSGGRAVPFRPDLPNLHIRAPNAAHDDLLIAFARARFRDALDEPFDAANLRVVTLGLSDDFELARAGARRFREALPRATERAETWARHLRVRDPAEQMRLLEPYRGKTIMLVGHVPADRNALFVFDAAGARHDIDIEGWMRVAGDLGVTLIPIGCDSARIASIGVRGLTNTGIVLRAVSRVAGGRTRTLGQFFGTLTGAELRLVIDPLEARLFGSGIAIEARGTRQPIGRILWRQSAPIWPRGVRVPDSRIPCPRGPDNQRRPCPVAPEGGSAGGGETPGGEASPTPDARQELMDAQQFWGKLAAVHSLTWLAAILLLIHGLQGARRAEKARGRVLRLMVEALLIVSLLALAGAAYFATVESVFILVPLILGGMLLPVVVLAMPRAGRRALGVPLAALAVAGVVGGLLVRQGAEIARLDTWIGALEKQVRPRLEPPPPPPSPPAHRDDYDPRNLF